MTALVAGGAGFVGSHLCEALLGRGEQVVCVDNLLTGRRSNIAHLLGDPGFRFLEEDAGQLAPDRLDVAGVDPATVGVVFHMASPASPQDYLRLPIETLDAGSRATAALLAVAAAGGARFVLGSSSEVYGDPFVHPQSEDYWGNVNPIGERSVYDEAKRFAEALTTAHRRRNGLATGIVRIFNTYGSRLKLDDGRVVSNFIAQALRGEPLTVYGDGTQTRSLCYVADLVEGLLAVADSTEAGPFNLGNPTELTVLELADVVLELTGSASTIEYRPLPSDDPRRRKPDIGRIGAELGWKPTTALRDGLAVTIEAIRTELER